MHLCCRPTTKKQHGKGNQVKPGSCFKLWMAKTGPWSKTLGRSIPSPCILHAQLQNAELQRGQQCGARDWPEAGRKPPRMRAGQEVHTVVKDLVQLAMEVCILPQCSLHKIQIKMVGTSISVAFRSIVPKIPGESEGQPGAIWGTREEVTLAAGPHFGPHMGETSETRLFSQGPSPHPLLFFSSRYVGWGGSY